jgi:hypothetical protein
LSIENDNTTFQLADSFDDTNRHFVPEIQESKVREGLKRMKSGKAMGPDGIPIKVWMPWGYSHSMANQVVRPYFPIEQDGRRVEKYIGTNIQE